jgi:hypothetical protein
MPQAYSACSTLLPAAAVVLERRTDAQTRVAGKPDLRQPGNFGNEFVRLQQARDACWRRPLAGISGNNNQTIKSGEPVPATQNCAQL